MRILPHRWSVAWATLTAAFAAHVLDEATHDFLAWYNPAALAIRDRLGVSFFPPTFGFTTWLAGLVLAVVVLAALTPLLRERRPWLLAASYVYGVIHLLNGFAHLIVSVTGRRLAPGVLSAPFLVAAAAWLLVETERVRRSGAVTPRAAR